MSHTLIRHIVMEGSRDGAQCGGNSRLASSSLICCAPTVKFKVLLPIKEIHGAHESSREAAADCCVVQKVGPAPEGCSGAPRCQSTAERLLANPDIILSRSFLIYGSFGCLTCSNPTANVTDTRTDDMDEPHMSEPHCKRSE